MQYLAQNSESVCQTVNQADTWSDVTYGLFVVSFQHKTSCWKLMETHSSFIQILQKKNKNPQLILRDQFSSFVA